MHPSQSPGSATAEHRPTQEEAKDGMLPKENCTSRHNRPVHFQALHEACPHHPAHRSSMSFWLIIPSCICYSSTEEG